MHVLFKLTLGLSTMAALWAPPLQGQTADEIIARYVEAIGGKAAVDAIRTLEFDRVLTHLEADEILRGVVWQSGDRAYRYQPHHPGRHRIIRGDTVWRGTADSLGVMHWTSRVAPGPAVPDIHARLGPFINYEEKGISVQFIETDTIDGIAMHHLIMVWPDDRRWEIYFDSVTGLFSAFEPAPNTLIRVYDYRQVGDVLFPHFTEGMGRRPDGRQWHHLNTMLRVEINGSLADSVFHPAGLAESGGRGMR